MNEENEKMEKIKKSCNAAMIVARVVKIFCIAMAVLTVGLGVGFIAFRDHIDALFLQAEAAGEFSLEEFSGTGVCSVCFISNRVTLLTKGKLQNSWESI